MSDRIENLLSQMRGASTLLLHVSEIGLHGADRHFAHRPDAYTEKLSGKNVSVLTVGPTKPAAAALRLTCDLLASQCVSHVFGMQLA
jgi:hypothetical protein